MAGQGVALRFSSALRGLLVDRLQHINSAECAASNAFRCLSSSAHDDGANVDFGFRQVPRDIKASLVGQVFSNVASSYDIMNDLMSGGLHRLWKERLVESLRPFPGHEHLDVAGGTGDVAFRVLRAIRAAEVAERMAAAAAGRPSASGRGPPRNPPHPHSHPHPPPSVPHSQQQQQPTDQVPAPSSSNSSSPISEGMAAAGDAQVGPGSSTRSGGGGGVPGWSLAGGGLNPGRVVVCDINPDMLRVGQQKAAASPDLAGDSGLSFVEGNAEVLPFPDASFDSYTIAFGIRNVTDRPAALAEALRVLKPGGRFLCMEFSHVTQPGLKEIYDMYSFAVIPRIGGLVANDAASYQYLVESIRKFPDQETFARMVEDAGFRAVAFENLTAGVVAIHSGFKL